MIEIKNLSLKYGGREVLKDLNLNIDSGKIIGLVGENGTGKSTLMRVLTGLEKNYKGEVLIDGNRPGGETNALISYQPDHLPFDDSMTIIDIGNIYERFYDDFDAENYYKMIDSFSIERNLKIKECSKGMKDKVQIAASLARKTDFYLLDEPMTGIDPKARYEMLNTIIENFSPESTLLISTHLITEIEKILDEVIIISNGKVLAHKAVDEIREENGLSLEEYFREVL